MMKIWEGFRTTNKGICRGKFGARGPESDGENRTAV
jgi:hypothetical protein